MTGHWNNCFSHENILLSSNTRVVFHSKLSPSQGMRNDNQSPFLQTLQSSFPERKRPCHMSFFEFIAFGSIVFKY